MPSNGLNRSDGVFYSLTVEVENAYETCQKSRFILDITVAPNVIEFVNPSIASVPENSEIGTAVTTIDVEEGTGNILYSIASSNVPFSIDPTEGVISVLNTLDFETTSVYNVTVEAENVGTVVTGETTVTISIEDVNEQPVWVTECALDNSCQYTVPENQPPNTVGLALAVTDLDLASVLNGQITYRITGGNQIPFAVGTDGQVSTTEFLDQETRNSYSFTVEASDGGNPSLYIETMFQVMVGDLNDNPPVFIQVPTNISLPENEPVGNVVAQFIAADEDTPPHAEITYSLSAPNGATLPFSLDGDDGALSISQLIDYEDLLSQEYTILVTANNSPHLTTVESVVTVTDINDNSPDFGRNEYNFSIPENSPINNVVGTVSATDADYGSNGDVEYHITAGDYQGFFAIDRVTGRVTVQGFIDREQVMRFELTVCARDNGIPRHSELTLVTITVTDINDHQPIFYPSVYMSVLREDISINTEIFTVYATDSDESGNPNSDIVYSIVEGNTGNAFSIGSSSGVLSIASMLDHETTSSYSLVIRAADQGLPQMFDTATASVTIININEAPPSLSGNQTVAVSEKAPKYFQIANFSAVDPDFMTVTFCIEFGNEEGKFSIDTVGVVSLNTTLDFETTEFYLLGVVATDGEKINQSFISVNVIDENEHTPQFHGTHSFNVDEELPAGELVGVVIASDDDGSSPNNAVTYSSTSSSFSNYFNLNSTTGEIRTTAVLDREELVHVFGVPSSTLNVPIIARDGGSPPLQSVIRTTITLRDINDNSPVFVESAYKATLFENQPAQTILTVSATDLDLGVNSDIDYSFTVVPLSEASLFRIDGMEISTTGELDCEEAAIYSFSITATDNGSPSQSTNVSGTLFLQDQNDNSPIFTESVYMFDVPEDLAPKSSIWSVLATDADKRSNGEVVYSIIGQEFIDAVVVETATDSPPFFVINENTGEIMHQTQFDFELFPHVNITVEAEDRGAPKKSSTVVVVFSALNVDEVPPRFLDSCSSELVLEDTPVETVVVDCMATDTDNVTTLDDPYWITYTIFYGNDDNVFRIENNTGLIRNIAVLDFERTSQYTLGVRAEDGSGQEAIIFLNIDILDANDNAPQFLSSSYSFFMSQEAIRLSTRNLVMVQAVDRDLGSNGEVMYSIADDAIERVGNEAHVTITAFDRGKTPLTSTVILNVTFESECLLQRYTIHKTRGLVSVDVFCSIKVIPSARMTILGTNHTSFCSVLRNSLASYQWLLNGSALDQFRSFSEGQHKVQLTVHNFGFADTGAYACRVITAAGSLQTSIYSVSLLGKRYVTTKALTM